MPFGWFSKGSGSDDKTLAKAEKLEGAGRWAEALSYHEEALERDPASERAIRGSRNCRENLVRHNLEEAEAYRASDVSKAREHGKLALGLAGSHEDLKARASELLASLGQEVEARPPRASGPEPLFAKSCSCAAPCSIPDAEEPEQGEIDVEDLAEFYLDSCDPEERRAFDRLGEEFRAGFVLLHQGELEQARPHLERAAGNQPGEPGAHHALGLLASLQGRGDDARKHFERALALDPGLGPAVRHLAETLRESGDAPGAVELLSAWVGKRRDDAEAHLLLAVGLLETGDAQAAAASAREAQRHGEESDPRPPLLQARALQLLGDAQAAISTLQGLLSRKPDQLEALVALAQLLLEQGGGAAERAAEVFKRCYRLDHERGWWYLIQVARSYRARGWQAEAREVLAKAREELPEGEEAFTLWESASKALEA